MRRLQLNKYTRKVLLLISDTHAGHKLGLCSPNTVLETAVNGEIKKYTPDISEAQKYLWEVYQKGVEETIKLADKDEVMVIHDGDPTHGNMRGFEVMSSRTSDQVSIAKANFMEVLQHKNVKYVRFAIGTAIHEFGEGTSTYIIMDILREKYPHIDIQTVYHGLLNYSGVTIDYSHHGASPGTRGWLIGNEARYYLRSNMMKEVMSGNKPPDLYLRGHYHVCVREFLEIVANGTTYASWMLMLPGFTYKDDYTRRATRSEYKQTFGVIAVEIINGQIYQTHKFTETLDLRTRETIL